MSDTVFIKCLRTEAVIGVYDWERTITQPLIIDIELATDTAKAAASDHIEDALDYAAISRRIMETTQDSSHQLIETLAEQLAALVLSEFAVKAVKMTVTKPSAVPEAQAVGVVIERSA
jgi:dihydroneopterin aldolase